MSKTISNQDDVIDSRDVIERIEELESEIQDACDAYNEKHNTELDTEAFLDCEDADEPDQDDIDEYRALKKLEEEASSSPDWPYGETLIRESYFQDYAEELAEDCGMVPKNLGWPCDFIDWAAAADALKQDYYEVDFAGETYYIRA